MDWTSNLERSSKGFLIQECPGLDFDKPDFLPSQQDDFILREGRFQVRKQSLCGFLHKAGSRNSRHLWKP